MPTLAACNPRVVVPTPLVAEPAVGTRAGVAQHAPAGRARRLRHTLHHTGGARDNLPLRRGRLFDPSHFCEGVGPNAEVGQEHGVPPRTARNLVAQNGLAVVVHVEREGEHCEL